jgi:hypothetical protein
MIQHRQQYIVFNYIHSWDDLSIPRWSKCYDRKGRSTRQIDVLFLDGVGCVLMKRALSLMTLQEVISHLQEVSRLSQIKRCGPSAIQLDEPGMPRLGGVRGLYERNEMIPCFEVFWHIALSSTCRLCMCGSEEVGCFEEFGPFIRCHI